MNTFFDNIHVELEISRIIVSESFCLWDFQKYPNFLLKLQGKNLDFTLLSLTK